MSWKGLHYNVNPRYACGSPAMVSERQALRVAEDERQAHAAALTGSSGAAHRERAERLGLGPELIEGVPRSIAEEVTEHRDHWCVRDLVTGTIYRREFAGSRCRDCPKGCQPFKPARQSEGKDAQ